MFLLFKVLWTSWASHHSRARDWSAVLVLTACPQMLPGFSGIYVPLCPSFSQPFRVHSLDSARTKPKIKKMSQYFLAVLCALCSVLCSCFRQLYTSTSSIPLNKSDRSFIIHPEVKREEKRNILTNVRCCDVFIYPAAKCVTHRPIVAYMVRRSV